MTLTATHVWNTSLFVCTSFENVWIGGKSTSSIFRIASMSPICSPNHSVESRTAIGWSYSTSTQGKGGCQRLMPKRLRMSSFYIKAYAIILLAKCITLEDDRSYLILSSLQVSIDMTRINYLILSSLQWISTDRTIFTHSQSLDINSWRWLVVWRVQAAVDRHCVSQRLK